MAFNPFFFNDSPLPLELIHKALEELRYLNPTVEELKAKVDKLVADLDGAVREEVARVIEEMYNSGDFAEIIGSAISDSLKGKSGALDLQHIGRIIHVAHEWQNASSTSYETTNDVERYNYAQGGVTFDIDGERYWAVANVVNNGTHFRFNNACYIYVYKFNANETALTYVTRKAFGGVGHCNGMGYMNGYLYITPNSYQTPDAGSSTGYSGVLSTDIHRIPFDGTTLGSVETKTVDIGYLNGYIDGICSHNNELYFFDGRGDVFSYDWTTNTPTKIYENVKGNNTAYGGMQIDDNFIYFADYENYKIIRFNRALGVIDWTYYLPIKADCNTYRVGEFEHFTIINGMLYIAGCYQLGRAVQPLTVTRFFKQNLAKNNLTSLNQVWGWSSPTNTYYQTFFVNGDLYSDTDNPENPTGVHNDARAFRSILEAIDFIDGSEWVERGIIRVLQSQNTTPTEIFTTKPVYITGKAYYDDNDNTVPIIGAILAEFNNITLEYLAIRTLLPSGNGYMTADAITLINCNSTLHNIYLPTGVVSLGTDVKYGIYVNQGYCSLNQDLAFEHYVLPSAWESARTSAGVSNPVYCEGYVTTINSHRLYGKQDTDSPLTANIIA